MTTTHLEFSTEINDEMVADAQRLVGMPIRVEPYNQQASLDVIRHYAWGLGDRNPLFFDEEYAAAGPYGEIVAPPTFLYSSFDGAIGLGFPGVQPIYAGTEWEYFEPIRRDDQIVPTARMGEVTLHSGRTSSAFAIQRVHVDYHRKSDGVLLASALASTFRVPRSSANGGLSYEPRGQQHYTDDEIENIRAHAVSEYRRGAERLTAADIEVGASVPEVVKGPIDQITMTAYYAGCVGSPGYKACEIAWMYRTWAVTDPDRLPNNYDTTYFSERVLPSLGHQNSEFAHEIGMPGPYNNGPQKCGWLAHPVLNWMGDHARLTRLSTRLRRPDIFGDTVWCGATVTGIEGDHVTLDLHARNQLGDLTAEGTATIQLS